MRLALLTMPLLPTKLTGLNLPDNIIDWIAFISL